MGKTFKHQDTYDYLHGKDIKPSRLAKLLRFFNRLNFFDDYCKNSHLKHKNFVRGGETNHKTNDDNETNS